MSSERLCLLSVHAHPDDESSKGAGTVARYKKEGVETVLVCCTGGEEGDILNPAMEKPEVRENLSAIRHQELADAAAIIGYDHVELLGYRDSGMAGQESNNNPESFAQAPTEEAVGRLVALVRKHRPQVIITYGDEQEMYPHPDHLRVHDITVSAWPAFGDGTRFPEAGEPWQPQKLYYSWMSHARIESMMEAMHAAGVEVPWADAWKAAPDNDYRITTRLDVSEFGDVRAGALRAHATQIDPESPFWFLSSPELDRRLNGEDDYVLAETSVEVDIPENDLFAGVVPEVSK